MKQAPTSPRTLMFLINSLKIGGAEHVFMKTANALARDPGTQVHFAFLFGGSADQLLLDELALPKERIFHAGASSPYDIRAMRKLAAHVKQNKVGVIYSTLNESNIVARALGMFLPVEVIIREANVAQGKPLSFKVLDVVLNLFARKIVCVSDEVKASHRKYMPFYAGKMQVVMNGVDIPLKAKVYSPEGPLRLLNVGSLTPKKGQKYLIEACALLKQDMKGNSDSGFYLSIVGAGSEETSLRQHASKLGLDEQVRFVAPLSAQEISKRYLDSDIFVLSSLWEGCPNVLLEAMAHGLACISTDVSGARAIIGDGDSGRIVPRMDARALADAIRSLGADKPKLAEYGTNARQRMIQGFSFADYVDKVRSLLYAG